MEKQNLPIGEFSRISDIPISTLRYYDEIELLKPADVDPFSQYRYYSVSQLYDANFIETWKGLGFTLSEIKCLMSKGTGDLAESCYRKQIQAMEDEITRRQQRKDEMVRKLQVLNRFSNLTPDEISRIDRKIIPEEHILTLEDQRPFDYGILVEKRKRLEKLAGKHRLTPAGDSPFLTTRFLETCREEGPGILYQLPLDAPGDQPVREIVKVPAHAALCTYHSGNTDVCSTVDRILRYAENGKMNIGKSITFVYWIDPTVTPDERLHVTEIRIPLKKQRPLDSQVT